MVHLPPEDRSAVPGKHAAPRWAAIFIVGLIAIVVIALLTVKGTDSNAGPTDSPSETGDAHSSTPMDDPATQDSTGPASGTATTTPTKPSHSPSASHAGKGTTTPSATATPTGKGTPSGKGKTTGNTTPAGPAPHATLDEERAEKTVRAAVSPRVLTAKTEKSLRSSVENVAIDDYQEELSAQWLELDSQGWALKGSPTITSLTIDSIDAQSDPPTAQVTACLDSSDVVRVDADGAPIEDPARTDSRALNTFTLMQGDDGIWRVSAHSFPDDTSC